MVLAFSLAVYSIYKGFKSNEGVDIFGGVVLIFILGFALGIVSEETRNGVYDSPSEVIEIERKMK